MNSGDYLLDAFKRRKTSLGITRFINRFHRDLIERRYKTGYNNDFRALRYIVENIEALLVFHPNDAWEREKNRLVVREANIYGMNRFRRTDSLAS